MMMMVAMVQEGGPSLAGDELLADMLHQMVSSHHLTSCSEL